MRQLPLPPVDNDLLLGKIINNKKKEKRENLSKFKVKITSRYRFYEENCKNLNAIQPIPKVFEEIKDDLLSCYGSNIELSKARKSIYATMPQVFQSKCPYCLLNRPNTLDHYFDKSDYPEFSVFLPNLIPCCSECNALKGTSVFDKDKQREYIHFYYDEIPDYQFFYIRFNNTPEDIVPAICIFLKFSEETEKTKVDLLYSHFSKLKLIDKYKSSTNEKLSVIMKEIRLAIQNGYTDDIIYEMLEMRYQSLLEQYGFNYWETCILEGILNSPGFIGNIITEATDR